MSVTVHDPLEFEVLGSGLGFPEGPVIADDGTVSAVDIDGGRVFHIASGDVAVVAGPGGGPNGMAVETPTTPIIANNGGFLWSEVEGGIRILIVAAAGSLAVPHGGVCVAATRYSFDSLAIEEDGRVAIGAISDGIVVITPDGQELDVYPIPGNVTTNIAFGGTDRRLGVITLARSGRVVATAWPRPGLVVEPAHR
jgi:sugar lactone lactonase YvrE